MSALRRRLCDTRFVMLALAVLSAVAVACGNQPGATGGPGY